MLNKNMLIIDLETTGLSRWRHEIIEIAILPVDIRTMEQCGDMYHRKVKPVKLKTADPKALEINGYTPEGWKDAIDLDDMLLEIQPILKNKGMFAGANPQFDYGFLEYAYKEHSIKFPYMERRMFDVATLALPLLAMGYIESVSMSKLCEYFEIERVAAHTADGDVRDTLAVMRKLMPDFQKYQGADKLVSYNEVKDSMMRAFMEMHEKVDHAFNIVKEAFGNMHLKQRLFMDMVERDEHACSCDKGCTCKEE